MPPSHAINFRTTLNFAESGQRSDPADWIRNSNGASVSNCGSGRRGELQGLKNNILVELRPTGSAGGNRCGPTGVGYYGMRLKLTLNDFSTLLPYGARESLWCGRDGFWISMFLIRNIRFSAIFHAPRGTVDARRASLWDFINSTSPRWREWETVEKRERKAEDARTMCLRATLTLRVKAPWNITRAAYSLGP